LDEGEASDGDPQDELRRASYQEIADRQDTGSDGAR
jgi:hypothetical protein